MSEKVPSQAQSLPPCPSNMWNSKIWGRTRCVCESDVFSGHELEVEQGGFCSVHYHCERANRIRCDSGVVAVVVFYAWKTQQHMLTAGKSFDVPSRVVHQFQVYQSGKVREDYWADRGGRVRKNDIVRLTEGGMVKDLEELKELAPSTVWKNASR